MSAFGKALFLQSLQQNVMVKYKRPGPYF